MYLLIVLMPLLSSILAGFFGRKIGVTGAQIVACSLIVFTTVLAVVAFTEIETNGSPVSIYLFKWVDLESLNVYFGFNFDSLTTLMLIPVLFVSSLVHVYSIGYMSHDPHNQRFFSYLSLFTFMMIILVTANNYLLMFVGWEGVGICSYLLVSFWFTRIAANQSSIAAILTNRVGDCFLTIGMFAIIWSLGNLDYATIFSLSPFVNENIVTIIGICLLLGAMAKSSQIGLHVWLPMAMEGPTPVSALIHAATMVTAGVYLLIRSSPLIEYSATVLLLCLWIGAITSLISSLIGLFQQDIKKVIAYSTMSQLGLMVVAIGLSCYSLALFHLVNHAFYKALLFLGAGSVIHAVADKQDFRKYGGLKKFLPLSHSVMLIASLSLVAFPFMTGYFSKDFILESCYGKYDFSTITVYFIATVGAMFTTLYSVKTLYLTFETNPNGSLQDHKNVHEGNIFMSTPLVILALFSIYFGFITKDMFIGLGSDFFVDNSILIHPSNEITLTTEFAVPTIYKLLPFIFTITLIVTSFLISEYLIKTLMLFKFTRLGYNLFSFFNLRFLIELLYNRYITENILKSGEHTSRILDRGAIELVGPYGLENTTSFLSRKLSSLDTGVVTTYAVYILIAGLTYLCMPYTLLSISTFIILFFIFTNTTSMIKTIDLSTYIKEISATKNILQSKLDYMYYIKRAIRVTFIAVVLWLLRDLLVDLFNLNREYLIDIIMIANISNLFVIIIENIWPIPMYYGADYNNIPSEKRSITLLTQSVNNDSTRSNSPNGSGTSNSQGTNINVSDPRFGREFLEFEPSISPLIDRALQNKGQLITGSFTNGVPDEVTTPIGNVPYTGVNTTAPPDNFYLLSPDREVIGRRVTTTDAQGNKLEYQIVFVPTSEMMTQDNPYTRDRYFRNNARIMSWLGAELIPNGPWSTLSPQYLNQGLRFRYLFRLNNVRSDEAWGIYDSHQARLLYEEHNDNRFNHNSLDHKIYVPTDYSPVFPQGVHYPGTAPATPVLNAVLAANNNINNTPVLNAVLAANNNINNANTNTNNTNSNN